MEPLGLISPVKTNTIPIFAGNGQIPILSGAQLAPRSTGIEGRAQGIADWNNSAVAKSMNQLGSYFLENFDPDTLQQRKIRADQNELSKNLGDIRIKRGQAELEMLPDEMAMRKAELEMRRQDMEQVEQDRLFNQNLKKSLFPVQLESQKVDLETKKNVLFQNQEDKNALRQTQRSLFSPEGSDTQDNMTYAQAAYLSEQKDPALRAIGKTRLEELKQNKKTGGLSLTPAQEEVDKKFAKNYADYVSQGGETSVERNIEDLDKVLARLEKGGQTGIIDSLGRVTRINPDAIDTKDIVENVVQQSLRQTLGAQFTEKEAARLIERAYNPLLDESYNIERIKALKKAVETAHEQQKKAYDYFNENGTLKGYDGTLPSISTVENDFEGAASKTSPDAVREIFNKQTGETMKVRLNPETNSWEPVEQAQPESSQPEKPKTQPKVDKNRKFGSVSFEDLRNG